MQTNGAARSRAIALFQRISVHGDQSNYTMCAYDSEKQNSDHLVMSLARLSSTSVRR